MVMSFLVMAVAAEERQAMGELKMGENFSIRKWSQQKLFRELLCLCTKGYLIEKDKQKEEEEEFHDLLVGYGMAVVAERAQPSQSISSLHCRCLPSKKTGR